MTKREIWLMTALTALIVPGVLAPALDAATFTVTKEDDDNGPCAVHDCALREAIIASNETPGLDRILIPGGRYVLSLSGLNDILSLTGDLNLWDDVEIIGDAALPVVIDAAGIDRVFAMIGSIVSISNLTITGGSFPGYGGGVSIIGCNVTITNVTITGNRSLTRDGGGLSVWAGNLVLINSNVSGNVAYGSGGGIERTGYPIEANVTLINTTVSGNEAGQAGAILSYDRGDLTLINSTISGNTAAVGVFGIHTSSAAGPIMTNSIVTDRCGFDHGSVTRSNGGNIVTPDSNCDPDHPADQQVELGELLLGPLADNGGPTMTRALRPGSPAIDAGVAADCPDTDQRGRPRPIDGDGDGVATCDAGAYELNPRAVEIPAVNPLGLIAFVLLIAATALVKMTRRALP